MGFEIDVFVVLVGISLLDNISAFKKNVEWSFTLFPSDVEVLGIQEWD